MNLTNEIREFSTMKVEYCREIGSNNSLLCIKLTSKKYPFGRYILITENQKFFTGYSVWYPFQSLCAEYTIYCNPKSIVNPEHKDLVETEIIFNLEKKHVKWDKKTLVKYVKDDKVDQFMNSDKIKGILDKVKKCRSCGTRDFNTDLCSSCVKEGIKLILLSCKYEKTSYFFRLPIEITKIIINYK